jgi:hypothetical protein
MRPFPANPLSRAIRTANHDLSPGVNQTTASTPDRPNWLVSARSVHSGSLNRDSNQRLECAPALFPIPILECHALGISSPKDRHLESDASLASGPTSRQGDAIDINS